MWEEEDAAGTVEGRVAVLKDAKKQVLEKVFASCMEAGVAARNKIASAVSREEACFVRVMVEGSVANTKCAVAPHRAVQHTALDMAVVQDACMKAAKGSFGEKAIALTTQCLLRLKCAMCS